MRRSNQSARGLALAVLRQWHKTSAFADSLLHDALTHAALSAADRAFATELVYGVIRNLRLLDLWVAHLRNGRVDEHTADVLRLGLYQLLRLATAEHAAVFETVELARPHARGAVNAVLRSAQRQRAKLLALALTTPLAIRTSHPDFLVGRWTQRFGAEATKALCEWNNEPAPIYARVNLLKTSVTDVRKHYAEALQVECAATILRFDHLPTDALNAGECYVQDPSTIIACDLLDPQPGERLLDACAAPGGKTGYIAERMENRGHIVATDRDCARVQLLRANLERLGVGIAEAIDYDWTRTHSDRPATIEKFDRILIDAPCSNTGVMRRRVDVRWRLTPADFVRMQSEQLAITRAVVPLLKRGGVLVYSTCSVEPEENEQVVEQLANEFPGVKLERVETRLPFRDKIDGMFAAKFTRQT